MSKENQAFVDQKLHALKRERGALEQRLEELERVDAPAQDPEALADEMLDGMKEFGRVLAMGTPEEKKLFVRGFVQGIAVSPTRHAASVSMLPLIPSGNQLGAVLLGSGTQNA